MLVPEEFRNHLQISDSRRKNFNDCARKFYWAYIRELTTPYGATPLRYGKCWHSVLEHFYNHIKDYGWDGLDPLGKSSIEAGLAKLKDTWDEETGDMEFPEDHRTMEALAESFIAYVNKWTAQDRHTLTIVETEKKFWVPTKLTKEEEKYFPYLIGKLLLFTGIIDMIIKDMGHIWAFEHKTTGMWMKTIMDTLRRSAQTQGYFKNAQEFYKPSGLYVEGIMINLAHLSGGKILKSGKTGVRKIEFERSPQMFTDGDTRDWRLSTLSVLNGIEQARVTNFYPVNLDNCHAYNKPCPYTSLCEQNKENLEDTITDSFVLRKRDV